MIRFHFCSLLVLLALRLPANAALGEGDSTRMHKWYVPHHIPVQFAGNIGLFSTGAGYVFNDGKYEVDFLYGYVPASLAATRIHSVTIKNSFPLGAFLVKDREAVIPYLGLGLSMEIAGNSFFRMPDNFPDSYYDMPKNLHAIAYGGMKLERSFMNDQGLFRGMQFYAEAGTLDVYLWYKAISNTIRFNQIFSLSLGANLLLNR